MQQLRAQTDRNFMMTHWLRNAPRTKSFRKNTLPFRPLRKSQAQSPVRAKSLPAQTRCAVWPVHSTGNWNLRNMYRCVLTSEKSGTLGLRRLFHGPRD